MEELHLDRVESSDLAESNANDTLLFRVGSDKFRLPPIFVSEFETEIIDCSMFVREFWDASRQTFAGSLEVSRLIFNRCFSRFSNPELGDSELRSCKNVLVTGVDKEEEPNESDLSDGVDGVKRNEGVDGESDDDILFSVFSLLLTLLVGSDVKADADLLMPGGLLQTEPRGDTETPESHESFLFKSGPDLFETVIDDDEGDNNDDDGGEGDNNDDDGGEEEDVSGDKGFEHIFSSFLLVTGLHEGDFSDLNL